MSRKNTLKPIAAALGSTFAVTVALVPIAKAAENPFGLSEFASGYMLAQAEQAPAPGTEARCKEGTCAGCRKVDESAEGKCGEGKCGAKGTKDFEGKCGEGQCGGGVGKQESESGT